MQFALQLYASATRREVATVVCVHRERHEVVEEMVGRTFETTSVHSVQVGMIMEELQLRACLQSEVA